jgi:3-phosphoshikimate 1-carboxyvinyltransferase
MTRLTFDALPESLDYTVTLPTSKSLSNRALILQALSHHQFEIQQLSQAEDTTRLRDLLAYDSSLLDCGNAGTVFRFLTAYTALMPGKWYLTGNERMKERPVGPLVEALRSLGATIYYTETEGYPPLEIHGGSVKGGQVTLNAAISSQFVTALLLIAPFTSQGIHLVFSGVPVSRPYFAMTIKMLQYFNVRVEQKSNEVAVYPKAQLPPKALTIEPDWTSASYWIGLAGLLPGSRLFFPGIPKRSWQGDQAILDLAGGFGLQRKPRTDGLQITSHEQLPDYFEGFLTDHPDLVPTLVAMCAAARVPFNLLGLAHLRDKETDRLAALKEELTHVGAVVETSADGLSCDYYQEEPASHVTIHTYQDHRMAMSAVLLALKHPGLSIADPDVVTKSYPGFWDQLAEAGFAYHHKEDEH